jgi:hypothetical protein
MIKKVVIVAFITFLSANAMAQNKIVTTQPNLNPKPTFFGGGMILGGGSGSFQIGLNPELVKSYNQYIDMGVALNFYYASFKTNALMSGYSYKNNNTQLGIGGFMRVWPIDQFFLQIQPEYNWTFTRARDFTEGTSGRSSVSAPSVLAGIGYGKRNEDGFSYFSVMFDLVNSKQSPYRMGQLTAQPIIRAGFGIPIQLLKPKSKRP